ncbi:hypothetical protein [Acinetobacter qingfengensis]
MCFIEQQLSNPTTIAQEVLGFFDWFKQQKIISIWSEQHIQALLKQQILNTQLSASLITQIEQHIAQALQHPVNIHTTIEDVIPVETVDQIAQYIASKHQHRQALIQKIVTNESYIELVTNIVQQSLKDYLDQTVASKRIPGVGSFMKMGKSVIELATDQNFDDTIKIYLQKNISKISNISEQLINQSLDEEKLYHWQAKLWHQIKKMPLSQLQNYILVEDLPQTVTMTTQIWQHLRQTPYLQQQVADGIRLWLKAHETETFAKILADLNINDELLKNELYELMMPIIEQLINDGYLIQRIRFYLKEFYNSEQVTNILLNSKL